MERWLNLKLRKIIWDYFQSELQIRSLLFLARKLASNVSERLKLWDWNSWSSGLAYSIDDTWRSRRWSLERDECVQCLYRSLIYSFHDVANEPLENLLEHKYLLKNYSTDTLKHIYATQTIQVLFLWQAVNLKFNDYYHFHLLILGKMHGETFLWKIL